MSSIDVDATTGAANTNGYHPDDPTVIPDPPKSKRQQRAAIKKWAPRVVALLAALGSLLADGAPTGIRLWDAALTFYLVFFVVLAASRAPRWPVILMSALAAGLGGFSGAGLLAWVALVLVAGSALLGRRDRLVGAVAAALAAQALIRLPAIGFFGLPSLVAGVAFVIVAVMGYRFADRKARRVIRAGGLMVVIAAVVIALAGGVALLSARSDIDVGIDTAQRALDAARQGDPAVVAEELARAEQFLQSANDRVTGPAARGLRLLPIVSQHHRAVADATAVGGTVASNAATMVNDLDLAGISLEPGSTDLAVIESIAPRLQDTLAAVTGARADLSAATSPWLLPALKGRLDAFAAEVGELVPELELAVNATAAVPALLGSERPQQYLVMIGTPAEAREFGGFVGSYALISFDQGVVDVIESSRISALYDIAAQGSVDPATTTPWYLEMARPTQYPQNLTGSPDFRLIADMTRQVLGGISEAPLDGVIYLDAWALIDILQLTGPVQVPFQDAPLTHDNAQQFFFRDQYVYESSDRTDLFDTLAVSAEQVLDQLALAALPGPERLGAVLGPAARGGHLQVVTFNDEHNAFLEQVKLLRPFGRDQTTDFVGLVHANGLPNKMDLYLNRSLTYDVAIDEGGNVSGTATATLQSNIPDGAAPYTLGSGETIRTNKVILSLYTPLQVSQVRVDGVPTEFVASPEFGVGRYLLAVDVAPTGQVYEVAFDLNGQWPGVGADYSLEVWRQPLVNTDQVLVQVRGPGFEVDASGPLTENWILQMEPTAN